MQIIGVLIALLFFPVASHGQEFGTFRGEIVARWSGDGRIMTLIEPFTFIDKRALEWTAPKGASTDGASIPRVFWSIYAPFTGQYRSAAVIHDYYCDKKTRTWKATHEVFYNAMRAAGVPETQAKVLYGAVYYFGPRWGIGAGNRGPGATRAKTEEEQERVRKRLEELVASENPNLAEIDKMLDQL